MAFTPKDWRDLPDVTTPLSASALEDMEIRVTDYADDVASEAQSNAENYADSREIATRNDLTGDLMLYADGVAQQAEDDAADYTDAAVAAAAFPSAKGLYVADGDVVNSTTYVTATTPDSISGIVTSNNLGILEIGFRALWRESSMDAFARAAIFIDGDQLNILRGMGSPGTQAACFPGGSTSNNDQPLITFPIGLCSMNTSGGVPSATLPATFDTPLALGAQWGAGIGGFSGATWTDDDTTRRHDYVGGSQSPQGYWAGGGTVLVTVPEGNHTVEIRYKVASTYSLTVKERRLWVRALEHTAA